MLYHCMEPNVQILYELGPCMAVCKPAGLSTQAPPGIDSLEVRIKEYLRRRDNRLGKVYLGVPHRLDRPASGVLVFGLHSRAAHRLSLQFERRQIQKVYWACVQGLVSPSSGTWTDHLRKIPDQPRAEVVDGTHPESRLAVLHYETLATADWGSWLQIQLETGRMHQIRIQAATRGHPLLGDVFYGATRDFGPPQTDERFRAIALHARSLTFQHPMTREMVTVTAPVPSAWDELGIAVASG